MERILTFQHLQNQEDILSVCIHIRKTANVPSTFFAWDMVASIRVVSGETPLDGLTFPIVGDHDVAYDEVVTRIMRHHPQYSLVTNST